MGQVEVQFELGEVESTKSKVVVISSTTDNQKFTSDILMIKINSMVNKT
jgi:hypothetical protein